MNVLITGACGFVGSTLALGLLERSSSTRVTGIDNFSRPGSETNRSRLARSGIRLIHGDLRCADDLELVPQCDWVIDAAANPSVLAGVDGQSSSRQVFDHNLTSTINLLEFCKKRRAGFVLFSTSRVYSIHALSTLPMCERGGAFEPDPAATLPPGASEEGVAESFSTEPPISLYGVSKLASEALALEYGYTFNFPVWINRCGVLAGAGQFGRPDQGIFSYWINSYLRKRPLKYIGFAGRGLQTRDAFHPRDLLSLLEKQFAAGDLAMPRVVNLGGGRTNAMSLRQLSEWCAQRFGLAEIASDPRERIFDIPWMVMDYQKAASHWGWRPQTSLEQILEEIARHAEQNENWLDLSGSS